jgi:hypothetical protein
MARGRSSKSIVSFNAGELSPLLDARIDIGKYSNGCQQLVNAIIETYGAARRRPGLQFIAAAKEADTKGRLIDFQFSTSTTFPLELGDEYMRFYSNGVQVESSGSPYEISTPWTDADVFEVQMAQINDVAYMTHPDYPVQKLSRLADDNWTLEAVDFDRPALLDENITDTTITPSGTTGSITLTASASLFQAGHVGSRWQIAHLREAAYVERNITSNGSSSSLRVLGKWNVRTYGVWDATVSVERSIDGGSSWERIRQFTGSADRNVDVEGEQLTEALLRVTVADYAAASPAGATTPRVVIEAVDAFIYGIVEITGYTSATVVDATVIHELETTDATKTWSEGAWSDVRGYPRTVTLFEQRLCFAGSTHQPQTVWGSATGDYENFQLGTLDSDAFAYTIGATERNAIEWIVTQKALLIGTSGGEWSMGGSEGSALTPTSVRVVRQSTYGSKNIPAQVVNEVALFTQRQGRRVRELTYSFEKDGYVAPDLTILAEHITGSGIVQTAYQQQPQSVLWAVTSDGELIGMTYEREQDVVGWHRHTTDGLFESVAVIYGDEDDEIWVVVKREVDGSTVRYVERFNPTKWTEKKDAFFVDSGLSISPPAPIEIAGVTPLLKFTTTLPDGTVQRGYEFQILTATAHGLSDGDGITIEGTGLTEIDGKQFAVEVLLPQLVQLLYYDRVGTSGPWVGSTDGSGDYFFEYTLNKELSTDFTDGTLSEIYLILSGLDHLEGKTVSILADGGVEPDQVVTGGMVTLTAPAKTVHVGLPYTTTIQPMKLDVDGALGVTQGQVKQVRELVVRLRNTIGLTYSNGTTEYPLSFRATDDPMDASPALFTGDKQIGFPGAHDLDVPFILKQTQPLPLTVLAIIVKYDATGN